MKDEEDPLNSYLPFEKVNTNVKIGLHILIIYTIAPLVGSILAGITHRLIQKASRPLTFEPKVEGNKGNQQGLGLGQSWRSTQIYIRQQSIQGFPNSPS